MKTQSPPDDSLDDEACWISASRAAGGHDPNGAPAQLMVERLRRLEAFERETRGSRQTLQKLMSARRLLGDTTDLGPCTRPLSLH